MNFMKYKNLRRKGYLLGESRELFNDYEKIRECMEYIMDKKANTMFGSCYVSDNRDDEIAVEIEGYDSTGGDAVVSLVFKAGSTFGETMRALSEELNDYASDYDPDEEVKMYMNSGFAGVPSVRELVKAMDEREEDIKELANAVSNYVNRLK